MSADLELVAETACDGPPVADLVPVRAPKAVQPDLGLVVPSEWWRNPTGDLLADMADENDLANMQADGLPGWDYDGR